MLVCLLSRALFLLPDTSIGVVNRTGAIPRGPITCVSSYRAVGIVRYPPLDRIVSLHFLTTARTPEPKDLLPQSSRQRVSNPNPIDIGNLPDEKAFSENRFQEQGEGATNALRTAVYSCLPRTWSSSSLLCRRSSETVSSRSSTRPPLATATSRSCKTSCSSLLTSRSCGEKERASEREVVFASILNHTSTSDGTAYAGF